jgi:cell division protein FtsB
MFSKLSIDSLIYFVLSLILIFLLKGLLSKETGIFKVNEVMKIKAKLIEEIHQLEEENKNLAVEILSLRMDPFWTEKIAREELDMVKPEEIVIKFRE